MLPSTVTLVGVNGGLGSQFARHLVSSGIDVIGVDRDAESHVAALKTYVSANLPEDIQTLEHVVGQSGTLVLALPEGPLLENLAALTAMLAPGSLVVDLLSVKSLVAAQYRSGRNDLEYLSVHPMFAPTLDIAGQNVVVVSDLSGAKGRSFIDLLRDWGGRVTCLDAETHDRHTAIIQAATHAALLAFGSVLAESKYDVGLGLEIATPVHRTMLALLARILNGDPGVYWDIQVSNPQASSARSVLAGGLLALDEVAERGDQQGFEEMLDAARHALQSELDALNAHCARLFLVDHG